MHQIRRIRAARSWRHESAQSLKKARILESAAARATLPERTGLANAGDRALEPVWRKAQSCENKKKEVSHECGSQAACDDRPRYRGALVPACFRKPGARRA